MRSVSSDNTNAASGQGPNEVSTPKPLLIRVDRDDDDAVWIADSGDRAW